MTCNLSTKCVHDGTCEEVFGMCPYHRMYDHPRTWKQFGDDGHWDPSTMTEPVSHNTAVEPPPEE